MKRNVRVRLVEGEGFEPSGPFGSPTYKVGVLSRLTTPPLMKAGAGFAPAQDGEAIRPHF